VLAVYLFLGTVAPLAQRAVLAGLALTAKASTQPALLALLVRGYYRDCWHPAGTIPNPESGWNTVDGVEAVSV
jgi:hypothetical protein